MADCPFCKINPEITHVIAERENVYVAMSNPRLVPGHLLVIPKRHIENIKDLLQRENDQLLSTIFDFEKRILNYSPGCDLRQNYRPFLKDGQLKVGHLHFHLLPRFENDELYTKSQIYEKDIFQPLPADDERQKFSDMFRDKNASYISSIASIPRR